MKRNISVPIETDTSGELCYIGCRFWLGNWCDAFNQELKRISSGHRFQRCDMCKRSEIRDVTETREAKHAKA